MKWSLAFFLVAACGTARTYRIDRAADTMAQVRIVRIVAGPDKTRVVLRYQAVGEPRRIGIHPPGHAGAFVITDAEETKTYRLRRVNGIAVLPDRTDLQPGEMLEFSLDFEPIPSSLKTIHVGEGRYSPESGETSWHFLDIPLKETR